jgi:signal transduction histidine kinase
LPVLTTVGAIRQLAAEEARRGYPVRIRGVVTLNNPHMSLMFVQDESGGIYVSPDKLPWLERTGFTQGMLVQIEGRTNFGRFSPTIRGKEDAAVVVKVLGRAPLPEPLQPPIVQLADPRYQNQWIEISGTVRQVTSESLFEGAVESVAVTVASPAGRVTAAAFCDPPTQKLPRELVGATVRVRGVFTAILNNNNQFLGMWLAAAALDDFHVVGPLPGKPFALPVRPIASLMRFDVLHSVSERVRIQGTVTQAVADRGMYVQGDDAAVYVKTIEPPQVRPGCRVDVAGFPAQGEWNPTLEDAVYQTCGSGPLPEPPAITTEKALSGDYDCRRVVMEGLLLQASLNPEQPTLVLQSGEKVFLALLADASDLSRLAGLAEDSWLRLEGVCINSRREDLLKQGPLKADVRPGRFQLLLASPDGVMVLRKPSWWTPPRILAAVAAVVLMAMAAVLWVVVLRYRVAVQTGIIRRQMARETVYEERGRIARELHDTLEQELAGISLQLDTVSAKLPDVPDTAHRLLDLTRLLLRHSRAEARRSIMDLRASLLESGDLASALQEVAARARDGQPVAVETVVEGQPRRLPGKIETNLLRIAQEALSNALKHGKPSRVKLWLSFAEQGVELRVEDDGTGFDVEQAMALSAGHFGLLGMRERAERIHAGFKIQSAVGKGTTIKVAADDKVPSP